MATSLVVFSVKGLNMITQMSNISRGELTAATVEYVACRPAVS